MIKKALQIAVALGLLIGAYAGYSRVFAIVAAFVGDGRDGEVDPFPETDSKYNLRATQLARESFGPTHWAARKDRKLVYYDSTSGYYFYAENYELLNGNKRLRVWPFALVWESKDGRSRKTATSEQAIIDLSQPFALLSKPSATPMRVVHAEMIHDVRLRDDKGTRDDPSDDLRIGPLSPKLVYDEATLKITSDSDVYLQDQNLTLTGIGLMIQLRRKPAPPASATGGAPASGPAAGFDAQTAFVYKDVHIVIKNASADGSLFGGAGKPGQDPAKAKAPTQVFCVNEMRVDLPEPKRQVAVGPPDIYAKPDPTLVKFNTNVRVYRGFDREDQLTSDTLDLTLLPKPPAEVVDAEGTPEDGEKIEVADAEADDAPPPSNGPFSNMKLRKALARGDAVWLQSELQGMVARCVELRYEKNLDDGQPDVTYLRGSPTRKLWVDKVEYDRDDRGQPRRSESGEARIKSILHLTAVDATIFDSGLGTSKIIARGPGKTEERPARNESVKRTAWWEDDMEMISWRDGEVSAPSLSPIAATAFKGSATTVGKGTLRRVITLTGSPRLVDVESATTLDSRKSIVAEFQAGPKAKPADPDGPTQIKWLDAQQDAHLTAPSKTLTARNFLKAKFLQPAPPPPVEPTGPIVAPTGPVVASTSPNPAPTLAEPPKADEPKVDAPTPAPDPAIDARADRVWANVLLGPPPKEGAGPKASGDLKGKGELKDAQLRGSVMVHQEPAPGKATGSDASGEALDLISQGNGLYLFAVKRDEPQASDPKTRLASATPDARRRRLPPVAMARVEFEGKVIESADLIGLNQKADFAWAQGLGTFTQMADRGLLDDKGLDGKREVAAKGDPKGAKRSDGPSPKDRLIIDWTEEMRFYGKSKDLAGNPAAKIEFRGASKEVTTPDGRREFRRGVMAKMTESAIQCDSMDVYMDRTIALNRDARTPASKSSGGPNANDAQIALLDCRGEDILDGDNRVKHHGVDIISVKLDPDDGLLKDKQRIQALHVLYDKRTGEFEAPTAGTVWLYRREEGNGKDEGRSNPLGGLSVKPVADRRVDATRAKPIAKAKAPQAPPRIKLTKVKFEEWMRGRFGVARDQVEPERREAHFVGSVQTADAVVASGMTELDFDRLKRSNPDFVFLTSDDLQVFSEPPPYGSKAPARQLLFAQGNGVARTIDSTIQADRITYDSLSELLYAYGDDNKEVSIVKADADGQPPSTLRCKALRYNKRTRASDLDDPQAIVFTDLRSGLRPNPNFPDLGGTPDFSNAANAKRGQFMRNGKLSTERGGFVGH